MTLLPPRPETHALPPLNSALKFVKTQPTQGLCCSHSLCPMTPHDALLTGSSGSYSRKAFGTGPTSKCLQQELSARVRPRADRVLTLHERSHLHRGGPHRALCRRLCGPRPLVPALAPSEALNGLQLPVVPCEPVFGTSASPWLRR